MGAVCRASMFAAVATNHHPTRQPPASVGMHACVQAATKQALLEGLVGEQERTVALKVRHRLTTAPAVHGCMLRPPHAWGAEAFHFLSGLNGRGRMFLKCRVCVCSYGASRSVLSVDERCADDRPSHPLCVCIMYAVPGGHACTA